jgi:hypothetical protein
LTIDDKTIRLTSELTLSQLLERTKKDGEVRLVDGDDVFIVKHRSDRVSDAAREFLMRGGPADSE